jgi:hypothetical protein
MGAVAKHRVASASANGFRSCIVRNNVPVHVYWSVFDAVATVARHASTWRYVAAHPTPAWSTLALHQAMLDDAGAVGAA